MIDNSSFENEKANNRHSVFLKHSPLETFCAPGSCDQYNKYTLYVIVYILPNISVRSSRLSAFHYR